MSISQQLFMDCDASLHDVRDVLVQAGIGLEATPDLTTASGYPMPGVVSPATTVIIRGDPLIRQRDNGVRARLYVNFQDRKLHMREPESGPVYDTETTRGVMALLRAYPDADAYWVAYDAEIPILLRRDGHLVLAEARTRDGGRWDAERQPFLAMVDLPYTVAPLGPWSELFPPKAPEAKGRTARVRRD